MLETLGLNKAMAYLSSFESSSEGFLWRRVTLKPKGWQQTARLDQMASPRF